MHTNPSTTCAHVSKTFVTYHSRGFALALPSETLIKFNLNDISIWIILSLFNRGKGKSDMKRETIWSSELVSKMRHPETDTCEQIFAPFEQLVNKWTLGTRKNYIYYYEVFNINIAFNVSTFFSGKTIFVQKNFPIGLSVLLPN